jgi:hypothetical protein
MVQFLPTNKTHRPYIGNGVKVAWLVLDNTRLSQPDGYWECWPSVCSITGERRYTYRESAVKAAGKAVMTFDFDYTRVTVVHQNPDDRKWYYINYVVPKAWWEEEKRQHYAAVKNHGVYTGPKNPHSIC